MECGGEIELNEFQSVVPSIMLTGDQQEQSKFNSLLRRCASVDWHTVHKTPDETDATDETDPTSEWQLSERAAPNLLRFAVKLMDIKSQETIKLIWFVD